MISAKRHFELYGSGDYRTQMFLKMLQQTLGDEHYLLHDKLIKVWFVHFNIVTLELFEGIEILLERSWSGEVIWQAGVNTDRCAARVYLSRTTVSNVRDRERDRNWHDLLDTLKVVSTIVTIIICSSNYAHYLFSGFLPNATRPDYDALLEHHFSQNRILSKHRVSEKTIWHFFWFYFFHFKGSEHKLGAGRYQGGEAKECPTQSIKSKVKHTSSHL